MKDRHVENLRRKMREFHRHNQWRLDGGLYIPHAYPALDTNELSWWDDVGFILNRRRVIVNWRHPRCKYLDAIKARAVTDVPPPQGELEPESHRKHWRKLGRSRKKLEYVEMQPASGEHAAYYDAVSTRQNELMCDGIDLAVEPSMRIGVCQWAIMMDLVAPLEIQSQKEVRALAAIAKRLLKREITVAGQWPGYSYGRVDWQSEASARQP